MRLELLKCKKVSEIKELFNKLSYSNSIDLYKKNTENQNFNSGYTETLEMILDSLKINGESVTINILVQYKFYLQDRYNRDIDIYGKDITLGWIRGSIEAIDWFFEG